jgi:hypothetical protein
LPFGAVAAIMSEFEAPTMNSRLTANYRVRAEANAIEERARGLAVEQSVEMPVSAIREAAILEEIVGRIARIEDRGDGWFDVDRRRRRRPIAQHALRQFLAAGRFRTRRILPVRRSDGAIRRAPPRPSGRASPRWRAL